MGMTRHDLGLALAALAAPFRYPGAFLRSATLPFLICMALAAALTLVDLAYPSPAGESSTDLPLFVDLLFLLLFGLAVLSLISFSIAWRRSLGCADENHAAASLLTIDTRTFRYFLTRIGFSASRNDTDAPPQMSWFRILFGILGQLLMVLCGMVAVITGAIVLVANGIPIQFFFFAIASCAFAYIWLVSADWKACSSVALGAFPEGSPSRSVSALRLFTLGPLATLLFFGLSIGLPVGIGEAEALLRIAVWLAVLFLVVAWFAALETLPFVAVERPVGLMPGGTGHRSFRGPVPGQRT
jgi:hypothetical protein